MPVTFGCLIIDFGIPNLFGGNFAQSIQRHRLNRVWQTRRVWREPNKWILRNIAYDCPKRQKYPYRPCFIWFPAFAISARVPLSAAGRTIRKTETHLMGILAKINYQRQTRFLVLPLRREQDIRDSGVPSCPERDCGRANDKSNSPLRGIPPRSYRQTDIRSGSDSAAGYTERLSEQASPPPREAATTPPAC